MPDELMGFGAQDTVLIEFSAKHQNEVALLQTLERMASRLGLHSDYGKAWRDVSQPRVTLYLPGSTVSGGVEPLDGLVRDCLAGHANGLIEISRLVAVRGFSGAAPQEVAHFHYVVRTDVAPGGEAELERWYDEEHMPALAAVPGVVRARRMISVDAAPRYYACYDLMASDVREHPDWFAARSTDWSGHVRETFRNTRRATSRRLAAPAPRSS